MCLPEVVSRVCAVSDLEYNHGDTKELRKYQMPTVSGAEASSRGACGSRARLPWLGWRIVGHLLLRIETP